MSNIYEVLEEMTVEEYLKYIRSLLRNHKDQWHDFVTKVENHPVWIKFYNKNIMDFTIDGLHYGGRWDIPTQREFLAYVRKELEAAINKERIVNLTPHDVTVIVDDKQIIIPQSGAVCRLTMDRVVAKEIDGVPITELKITGCVGLPEPEKGTYYLVSTMTAKAFPERDDLLTVTDTVRNDNRAVIGCRSLSFNK